MCTTELEGFKSDDLEIQCRLKILRIINPCSFYFLTTKIDSLVFYILHLCFYSLCCEFELSNSSSLYNNLDSNYSHYLIEQEARVLHWNFTVMSLLLNYLNFALVAADKERVHIAMESNWVIDCLQYNYWPRIFTHPTDVYLLSVF